MTEHPITAKVSEYEVSILPRDNVNYTTWVIRVRDGGTHWGWKVEYLGHTLGTDGTWFYAEGPDERGNDEHMRTHRFPEQEALVRAKDAIRAVRINNLTADEILDQDITT